MQWMMITLVIIFLMCVFSVAAPVGASYYYDEPVTTTLGRIPAGIGLPGQVQQSASTGSTTGTTSTTTTTTSSGGVSTAGIPSAAQVIVKEVAKPCPNPAPCVVPECPPCECPAAPDCICPVTDNQLKAAEAESRYLKWMVRFLGAIARRENAVNRVMAKQCPGVFAMVPMVQEVDLETQFIQRHIRKDDDMYKYFQTNFSKYSGVPSKNYFEIL